MFWITSDQDYLLQGESFDLPAWATAEGEPGSPALRAAKFYLVGPFGALRRTFSAPSTGCEGDEFRWGDIHVVIEGDLRLYSALCRGYGHAIEVSREVMLSGLRAIRGEDLPFDPQRVIADCETQQQKQQAERAAAAWSEREAESRELLQFRQGLRLLGGPVQATWGYEPDGWVVTRRDGQVLGRGRNHGYGIHVYRKLLAILCEELGPDCNLEPRLSPHDEMLFYPD